MNRRSIFSWLFLFAFGLWLTGCGTDLDSSSDSDDDTDTASVRLVNLTSASDLVLTGGSSQLITGVASGSASAYVGASTDTTSYFVSSASTALSSSGSESLSLTADTRYTIVAYERAGLIKYQLRTDDDDVPTSGYTSLRIVNAGSDAGALDVYVVEPGTDITSLSPNFANVQAGYSSSLSVFASGTKDIIVTAADKLSDVRLKLSAITLTSGKVVSVFLTPTSGGTLVDGSLVEQGGAVERHSNGYARVRVVAGLPAGNASNVVVSTRIDSSNLGSVASPMLSAYKLVPAGTTSYSVSVDNVTLENLPTAKFASGGDYSLLVYGTTSGDAAVSVFTDNNLLPSSGAKLRLINGAVPLGGLALSVNYATQSSDIGYGDASEYSGITSGTTRLDLTSPSSMFPGYSNTVTIAATSVYSLFVLGTSNNPVVVLNKER